MLAACGGSSTPPARTATVATTPPPGPSEEELAATRARDDAAKRDEIVAAHRKLEEQQQDALAAKCEDHDKHANHQRCTPSCYAAAAPDPRAGKGGRGAVEIEHLVCQREPDGPFLIMDELDPKLRVRGLGRTTKRHRKGTWQADIEIALAADGIVVTGAWHDVTQPLTKERVRCVTASHYAGGLRRALDACGATGDIVCEASGNAAAHGLDVVRYRLSEARTLHGKGDTAGCQQAALEAAAVAHGLPRWRQYAKLNVDQWPKHARFRTRFDGTLDEETLFATAATLGGEAEAEYTACGGPGAPQSTPEQQQSFHTCW
jgi:hypothetical protein